MTDVQVEMLQGTLRGRVLHAPLLAATLLVAVPACTADLGTSAPDAGPSRVSDPGFDPLGGATPVTCDPSQAGVGIPRIWRLTRRQYDRTISALFGDDSKPASGFVPEPGSEQGFQNDSFQLRVRQAEAGQYQSAARTVAARAVSERLEDLFPCSADKLGDAACQESFVREFGARTFRRALTDTEVERYLALYRLGVTKEGGELGLTVTLEAMLQSPYFLYRFELGAYEPGATGLTTLTEHEIAAALSYYLTDGPPDEPLLAAAEAGALSSADARRSHAERLLQTDSGKGPVVEFYRQLLEYSSLDEVMKDPDVFPEFEGVRPEFHGEMEAFVKYTIFEGEGSLGAMLTANYTFVNDRLGAFLGLPSKGTDFVLARTDADKRAGLLSLAGLNSVLAAQTRTSPVNRGRFVREKLLCEHISDPPPTVDLNLPELEPGMTARQQLEAKTASASCRSCHSLMNPVGFGMETIDAIGRYRTEDNGQTLDSAGELTGTRDADGTFEGTPALAALLADSEQVQECMSIQAFRYALGRGENTADACTVVSIRDALASNGGDLKKIAPAIVQSDSFVVRDAGLATNSTAKK